VEPVAMNADEYRAMIELAKNAGPDDCEMCGS
jgi:ribonucleoside-diphosphate reductase alpha chain